MKNYYVVEKNEIRKDTLIDTHTYYMGTSLEEAQNKFDNAKLEKDQTLELRIFEFPDDVDMTDENAIINAICEYGYDVIKEISYKK